MNAPHTPLPSVEELLTRFTYDPETGNLLYRFSVGNAAKGSVAGSLADGGYLIVRINHHAYYVHRIVWRIVTGEDPLEVTVHHVDGRLTNNRFENLELK